MGAHISQRKPDAEQSTIVSTTASPGTDKRAPRYSPKMDDIAASQQLFDEQALHTQRTPRKLANIEGTEGATNTQTTTRRSHRTAGTRKSKKEVSEPRAASQPASSQDFPTVLSQSVPRSYALADLQAYTEGNEGNEASHMSPVSPSRAGIEEETLAEPFVEVPDSQTQSMAVRAVMSSPMNSGLPVPASPSGKRTKKGKGQPKVRAEVDPNNILPIEASTTDPEAESMSLSQLRTKYRSRRQRMTYLTPPPAAGQGEMHVSTKNPDTMTLQSGNIGTNGVAESPAHSRKLGAKQNVRVWEITNNDNPDAEAEVVEGRSRSLGNQLRRMKNAKSSPASLDAGTISRNDETPLDLDGNDAVDRDGHDEHANSKDQGDSTSGEDEIPPVAPSDRRVVAKKPRREKIVEELKTPIRRRKSRRESEIRPKIRKGKVNANDTVTAAERALDTERELHYPPDLRTDGEFTHDEEELIRRAIRDFQQRKGLDTSEIVEIIQWTYDDVDGTNGWRSAAGKRDSNALGHDLEQESREFWEEIKYINLTRKSESVRRHVRSQYHSYKSGGWTKEEDEQLRRLHELHPHKWKLISTIMSDRSMHDVQKRYRDYVQYGNKRNISVWSKDEEDLLVRTVNTVAQRDEDYRAEAGLPPRVEYTSGDINWPQVSLEMGGIRSRLQSSVKWAKMLAREFPPQVRVEIKPRNEAEQVGKSATTKKGQSQKSSRQQPAKTPRKRGRSRKSEDPDNDQDEKTTKRRRRERTTQAASDIPTHPPLHRSSDAPTTNTPGCSPMRPGDKFQLAYAISHRGDKDDGDIDWPAVQAAMKQPWSVRTLQAALRELLEEHGERVTEDMSFQDTMFSIVNHLAAEYPEELDDHYDPFSDIESDDNMGSTIEAEEEPAAANTKRKRMKGRSTSRPTTPKVYNSKELIVESDDDESQAEL